MFTLKCFNKTKHMGDYLIEIYSSGSDDEKTSIKWCTECGAVVGDIEVDDRVCGRLFDMNFPKLVKLRDNK